MDEKTLQATETLYYDDSYTLEFQARVIESVKEKKRWRVLLDRTYFYPEGGGQPADRGRIKGIPVLDVQKKDQWIYHYLEKDPGLGPVEAKIDDQWRHDFMQQHTGQHIISGALWQVGRYKTVSVHMGLDYTTIEVDAPEVNREDLAAVEKMANNLINRNLALEFIYTDSENVHKYPLRKPTGHNGKIRLVQIGDFDCVGCGGLHFNETRYVELVKVTGVEKIRGHARLTWKIGQRAFEDYHVKDRVISGLRSVLGTREDGFIQKTQELMQELTIAKRRSSWLENRLAETMVQELAREALTVTGQDFRLLCRSWKNEDSHLLKKILKELLKEDKILICLINISNEKLSWMIGCSEDVEFSFDTMKAELLPLVAGKGGGRYPLWQGTGNDLTGIDEFLVRFTTLVNKTSEKKEVL